MSMECVNDGCADIHGRPEAQGNWSCCGYYAHVYRHLLMRTRSASLADDLTQETMIQAMRRMECFQGRGTFENWLVVIANNLFNRYLGREKCLRRHAQLRSAEASSGLGEEDGEELIEAIRDLHIEVAALPQSLRLPLEVTALQNHNYADAAVILKISVSTLRVRIHRAKKILAKRLRKHKRLFCENPSS